LWRVAAVQVVRALLNQPSYVAVVVAVKFLLGRLRFLRAKLSLLLWVLLALLELRQQVARVVLAQFKLAH
jgi:hypothetical protein